MFCSVLRYLGLDEETRKVRALAKANLEKASEAIDQLQERFVASSRNSVTAREDITKALRDSEIDIELPRRAARG